MTVFACNEYTSPAGTYYNIPDNYVFTDIIPSVNCPGVDSVINIDLTIVTSINTSIFVFSGVVFVNQLGADYQWLDCDNNMAPIPGETNQDFIPTVDGNYACEITLGSCVDTTGCEFVEAAPPTGISESEHDDDFEVSIFKLNL